jgi:Ca-activated chloride channel family protein
LAQLFIGCAASLFFLSGFFNSLSLDQNPPRRDESSTPRFNVDTTLVLIPVTVTDLSNRFVLGLRKQDFHVFEAGVEQTIAHFSGEDAPLSIGLLFDASGSMLGKLRTSRKAASQFLQTMNPQDEAFLRWRRQQQQVLLGPDSILGPRS